jgi:hypothetical protein
MPTAHGSSYAHAPTSTHLDSLGDPQHDSRGAGEALSRLALDMPFMGPLKQGLSLFLIQAYSPILKPFEILNLVTNHMFSKLAPNAADKSYELLYKVIPTEFISKTAAKIGLTGGDITNKVSNFIVSGLRKAKIEINEAQINPLINEIVKDLSHMYNPEFLKQFNAKDGRGFLSRTFEEGTKPYKDLAEFFITRAWVNAGETVSKALSQGMNAISDGTAQAAVTEAIKDTAQKTTDRVKQTANLATQKIQNTQKQILDDSKQALNKGKQIASQAVQSITPQTQKPATDKTDKKDKKDKKAQGPNNNSQPGLFSNLLTTGSNIIKSITGIFSPKPAPAAA